MDFPIPATIEPIYDPEAKVVINTNPDVYREKRLEVRTAGELSRIYRDLEYKEGRLTNALSAIDFAEQYIKKNYEDIGEEHAKELADILGFDLATTVEVEFSVTITATMTLPIGKDVSDLSEYDFDIEINSNESDYEIEYQEAVIDRIKNA